MGHRTSEHLSSPLIRSSLQSCNTSRPALTRSRLGVIQRPKRIWIRAPSACAHFTTPAESRLGLDARTSWSFPERQPRNREVRWVRKARGEGSDVIDNI